MKRQSEAFTRRTLLKAGAAGAAVAMAGGITYSIEPPAKPNILLLMADQYRGDCLGCDGHPVVKTPNLDRLAHEGVRFTHAYSTTPTCTPARAALLTGLSPWRHGMLGYGKVAPKYPLEMPQALRDAGYYTLAIGKMHFHPQRITHGFHQTILDESSRAESPDFRSDYRCWFYNQAPHLNPDSTGITWNDYRSAVYVHPEELHPTAWTANTAINFLNTYQGEDPFFLKVSFARPHSPYDPPQRWMDAYKDADIPKAAVGDWESRYIPRSDASNNIWHGDMGAEQVRKSRQGYYGSVSFLDEHIGRIIRALEERNLLENTLILFLSDHGDMTGDHHLWRKSYAYEASARIPMIMRWPKSLLDAPRGVALDQPVEIRDALPTFLDAAGAPRADGLDGKSLLNLVRGKTEAWREYIDLEHCICYAEDNHWNGLTDGRMKYIYHAAEGSEQLFNLENDPQELHDLSKDAASQEQLALWRNRLIDHLRIRGEAFVSGGKLAIRKEAMLYSPNYPKQTEG